MARRVLVRLALFFSALAGGGCAPTAVPRASSPGPWATPPSLPALTPAGAGAAIQFAQAQLGKRYCWGGTGPDCFDCSGLVQAAWRSGGVRLPRTSAEQGRLLVEVPFDEIRAGDILWWRHHVGLYVGNGEMIDAYHSGAGVVRRRAAKPPRVLRVAD